MLSLLALEAALEVFGDLDMADVRARSLSLTGLFLELAESELVPRGFGIMTPRPDSVRGSQVSLTHPSAYGVVQALIARRVVGDYRAPDVVRLGFAPLYLRHVDVVTAVRHAAEAVDAGEHLDSRYSVQTTVT
jgi:kynureninase